MKLKENQKIRNFTGPYLIPTAKKKKTQADEVSSGTK